MHSIIDPILSALIHVEKGDSIRNAMNQIRASYSLSKDDEAKIYYFVFNIIGKLNVIDMYIKESSSYFSLKKLSYEKKAILRLVTFILKYGPQYIHLLESLKIKYESSFPKKKYFHFDSFVKKINSMTKETLEKNRDSISVLALKYYTPSWIVRRLHEQWGEDLALNFLRSIQHPLPSYVRLNTLKVEKKEVEEVFSSYNINYQLDKDLPDVIKIVKSPIALPRTELFKEGKIVLQQKSSALVSHILDPTPNDKILDMCASPGQKTSHIAALVKSGDNIVACELNKRRVSILKQRMSLLGVKGVEIVQADSRIASRLFHGKFSKILLDPPCTGSGTYSTRPETKFRLKKKDLKFYTTIQKQLLNEASHLLDVGGEIVYSTCSIFKEENIYLIEEFLSEHSDFSLVKTEPIVGFKVESLENKAQMLTPTHHETEGFFIVKMKKK